MTLSPIGDVLAPDLAPPDGLADSGLALWDALTTVYTFSAAELALVSEACRVKDRLDLLGAAIAADGPTATTARDGLKINPALSEARAQALTLARLIAALRLPDTDGNTPQRRGGARGTYLSRRAYGSSSTGK